MAGFFGRGLLSVPNGAIRWSTNWRDRPVIYAPDRHPPPLKALEANWVRIREEYLRAASGRAVAEAPEYHQVDPIQRRIAASVGGRWRILLFEVSGVKVEATRALMPFTASLIDAVPHVFHAFVSILEPGKSIPEHRNPYNGYIRYHLPLVVPATDPPYMVLNGKRMDWHEGTGILFDDTFPHSVVNACAETRAVLIVDIERPMGRAGRWLHRGLDSIVGRVRGRGMSARLKLMA